MSKPIISALIGNAQHPEYGVATIPFPLSREEYDHSIEVLSALGIGDAIKQDCRVDAIKSEYPILKRLEGQTVNVDELDYLAKRLDSFCEGEDAQFQCMAVKMGTSNIKDFIMDYLLFGRKGDSEMMKVGIDMAISCLATLRDNL